MESYPELFCKEPLCDIPGSVVNKIVRKVIPDDVRLEPEAKQALSAITIEFILYVTSCANDICTLTSNRCTLGRSHIEKAIEELDLSDFVTFQEKLQWSDFREVKKEILAKETPRKAKQAQKGKGRPLKRRLVAAEAKKLEAERAQLDAAGGLEDTASNIVYGSAKGDEDSEDFVDIDVDS